MHIIYLYFHFFFNIYIFSYHYLYLYMHIQYILSKQLKIFQSEADTFLKSNQIYYQIFFSGRWTLRRRCQMIHQRIPSTFHLDLYICFDCVRDIFFIERYPWEILTCVLVCVLILCHQFFCRKRVFSEESSDSDVIDRSSKFKTLNMKEVII